ncbi:MAG: hypothetical protein ACEPO8_08005 [Rhodothermaceae bacterium]
MKNKREPRVRTWLGISLILFGIFFFLDKAQIIYFDPPFELFGWSGFVMITGIIVFFASRSKVLGLLVFIVGLIFFFPPIWPLTIVALGLYLIYHKEKKIEPEEKINIDDISEIETMAIFGGGHKSYLLDDFKGGRATAIFGGSEINLRGCKISNSGAELEIISIFGGLTFEVPADWNVVVDVVSIFGGFHNSMVKSPVIEVNPEKTLIIKGVAIFGGGEVK